MGRRGEDLAKRFKQAIQHEEAARRAEEEERARRLEAQRQERAVLLEDLAAFGEAIGHIAVEHGDQGVVLRHADRFLAFEPKGDGERVEVKYTGMPDDEANRLYRQAELGHRWVWARSRRGVEDRLPLFDQGLENLLVHALQLPAPGPLAAPETSTLEGIVPTGADDRRRDL